MTRWVRSGSSQKHKKMPGDATKWGEFDNLCAGKIPPKNKKNVKSQSGIKQKFQSSTSISHSSKHEKSLNDFFEEGKDSLTRNSNNELEKHASGTSYSDVMPLSITNEVGNINFKTKDTNNFKIKKMKKQKNYNAKNSSFNKRNCEIDSDEVLNTQKKIKLEKDLSCVTEENEISKQGDDLSDFTKNGSSIQESFFQEPNKKKKKKKYNKAYSENLSLDEKNKEMSFSSDTFFDNSDDTSNEKQNVEYMNTSDKISKPRKSDQITKGFSKKQNLKKPDEIDSSSNMSPEKNENCKNSPTKILENKKEKYLKKLKKKREELGLLVLPRNVETKLRKIKKRLIEKGLPPEMQKEIMRQARRKEELKYRKVFNPSKLCFGCREPGHILADCPKKSENLKQETGICFKCGSVEHISFKCPEKVQGFPYANCFICKEQGHISRDCPQNKHGIYPKGGRCKLCGNVNHLKKDCPTLKKKENEEETITLHTFSEDASIDAEVVKKEEMKKTQAKKAKIVKF